MCLFLQKMKILQFMIIFQNNYSIDPNILRGFDDDM